VTSLPLHAAVVHLPLGLAFVIPALAAGFAWALWKGAVRPRAWLTIVALQAALLGAGLAATSTGEHEEERVERVVPHEALERHEAYADQFVWATAVTLVAAVLVLAGRKPAVARSLAVLTVVGTVAVAIAAIRVGHAGGELIYVHNAGSAYAAPNTSKPGHASEIRGRASDDERYPSTRLR
jgi:hypothetical protein